MKKYVSIIFTIVILAMLVAILSSSTFESVDSLMRPPKNEGQNSEIQAAFEASLNDKYILRSPLSGEHKSSFTLIDLDKDKNDEVVVFYSLSGSPDVARMNVIDNINGTWQSIASVESAHKQIHKVDFSDLDNNGTKEIIVGWSFADTELSNTANVYSLKADGDITKINKVFEADYTEYIICDVNSDRKNDILFFDKALNRNSSIKAVYYDFSEGKAFAGADFFVDPVISSIYSVCYDKDRDNGNIRFYIDGYRMDSGMTTDIFYWDSNEKSFRRPVYSSLKSISVAATRNTIIACKDINNDESIEIPFEEYIEKSELITVKKSGIRQQSIIKWMNYTAYGFDTVSYEIFNPESNYSLKIKNDWYGNFTVKNEPDKRLLTFCSLERPLLSPPSEKNEQRPNKNSLIFTEQNEDNKNESLLFSVLAVAENEDSSYNLSDYKYLKTDNGFNYFCCIYEKGKNKGITKEAIKKILIT